MVEELTDLIDNEKGSIDGPFYSTMVLGVIAMPICAYAGSYVFEGIGYLWGNLIDCIPLVRNIAPWMAERSGLVQNTEALADLNENLHQTTGAIGGFWGGMFLPWKIITEIYKGR